MKKMQAKISSFFKSSSSSSSAPKSPDPPPIFDGLFGDEDTVKKESEIRITYQRRAPQPDRFKYAAGDEGDVAVHKIHLCIVQEVVNMMEMERGEDCIYHKLCMAYLFIDSQRIAGCLVAEPIKKAYKVISTSLNERAKDMAPKLSRPNSTTIRFGEVIFRREVLRRATSITNSEALEVNLNGEIF